MSNKRVRLVFETENDGAEGAADLLQRLLTENIPIKDIFKEIKVLRPFTKKPGVTYGRPKEVEDTFGMD